MPCLSGFELHSRWVPLIPFLRNWTKEQYSEYITQKKIIYNKREKKKGSHLARYKLTNKFLLFKPQSASLSKFEFEPKGSKIS